LIQADDDDADNDADDHDGVWPENLPALTAFMRIKTQWVVTGVGMAGLLTIGLNYASAKAGLELAGIDVTPELWDDILVIEAGALPALNESTS
jgi:hypothetical protein